MSVFFSAWGLVSFVALSGRSLCIHDLGGAECKQRLKNPPLGLPAFRQDLELWSYNGSPHTTFAWSKWQF